MTCSATPSSTTSRALLTIALDPVVITHDLFDSMFLALRSSGPVVNHRASSSHTAMSGVT